MCVIAYFVLCMLGIDLHLLLAGSCLLVQIALQEICMLLQVHLLTVINSFLHLQLFLLCIKRLLGLRFFPFNILFQFSSMLINQTFLSIHLLVNFVVLLRYFTTFLAACAERRY